MSAISLKSITGITSITTPAGVDNQLTLHTNNTTERVKIDVAGNVHINNQLAVSGIVTSNTLRLPDATSGSLGRLQLGNSLDFSVYHDGTNSHIVNNNGYLTIQSQAGVNGIFIARNAEVNLYHGPSVRLQTSSSGVTINRDLDVDGHTNLDNVSIAGVTTYSDRIQMLDNKTIQFGSAAASRTSISYDGSKTVIRNFNDVLEIGDRNTEIHHTNQVRLSFLNGQNIFSNNASTTFTGSSYHAGWYPSSNAGTFKLNDNARLAFGTGADTNFFHNNSHFYLQNTTGNINVTGNIVLNNDISVDGHTNLDNVSIAGVTTTGNLYADNLYAQSSLTINNNSNVSVNLTSTSTSGSSRIFFGDPDSALVGRLTYSHNGDYMQFFTAYGERLRINGDGKVGINEANPNAMLHVENDNANASSYYLNTDAALLIQNKNSNASAKTVLKLEGPVGGGDCAIVYGDSSANLIFSDRQNERLRIESGGGLKFTGQGTSIPVGGILHHTNNNLYVRGGTNGLILSNDNNYTTIQIYDTYMKFETNDGTEKLRIESGGEIRLTSENGNNSDTPGFTFRGGSSSQKANFARIHSRMVSNWGGQLQFKVKDDNGSLSDAYQTAMIMDHNAYVTKPGHPAFFATHNGTDGSTSDGNLIELTTTRYNKNNVYSTSSYYFTAPVAGVYHFTGQVWAKNGTNHARWQFSYHNGSSWASITQHGFHGNSVNKTDFQQNASITYYMNSGDRMGMRVDNGPLAYYRGGGGAAHTFFCGHLVG